MRKSFGVTWKECSSCGFIRTNSDQCAECARSLKNVSTVKGKFLEENYLMHWKNKHKVKRDMSEEMSKKL